MLIFDENNDNKKPKLTHKGDKQAASFGNAVIEFCKTVGMAAVLVGRYFKFSWYGIKKITLSGKLNKIKFTLWLGVQAAALWQSLFSFMPQIEATMVSIPLFFVNFPLLHLLFKPKKLEEEREPNDDFIEIYSKMGFKDDFEKGLSYPYLVSVRQFGNKYVYYFKSNGNKIDKFNSNKELLEEVVNLQIDDIRRSDNNRSIVEVTFTEKVKADRLNIHTEMKKDIENDSSSIPLDSVSDWDYKKAPHGLVTGCTGGGKTYFLFYMIRQLAARGADIYICDPKLSDLSTLDRYIGTKCAFEKEDIVKLVEKFATDMKKRYREIRKKEDFKAGKNYADYNYQPKFLIFDECMSFFGGSTEKSDKKTVKDYLMDVIAEGRQAGYFVILTTQRADTKFIDGAIRDQLGLRASLGSLSDDGYKMTFGKTDYKLRDNSKGAGFIYIDGLGMTRAREYVSPLITKDYDFFEDFKSMINLEEDTTNLVKADFKKEEKKDTKEAKTFEELQKEFLESEKLSKSNEN